jgi:hypothetical protein
LAGKNLFTTETQRTQRRFFFPTENTEGTEKRIMKTPVMPVSSVVNQSYHDDRVNGATEITEKSNE